MSDVASYNDSPITDPAADRFGLDPFAKTLAAGIRKLASPEGLVVALNGPWGSGKSSAVNLVTHHLKDAVEAGEFTIINFVCWWFRGEEALALAFFRELYAGLGPTLGDRFKKALPKLGARLLRAGGLVGAGVDLAGAAGAGSVAANAMGWVSGLIQQDETIEKLHADLTKALSDQTKRFLIVIDDIDRLAPEEALLIFRLVKSVGRLPNVIYLLVFDRQLAEAVVAKRYPSEGTHYLEKIIQASFDVPEARHADLTQQLLEKISSISGPPVEADIVRFMNIFYDVIAPEVRTPRDLIRLMNGLSVSWPAIGRELDKADFLAIETLRMLRPNIYHALRRGKERLCGAGESFGVHSPQNQAGEYDREFLVSADDAKKETIRRALRRLFPRLDSVWSNMHHSGDNEWARQRRICSESHFDAYFRFSLGEETLSRDEIGRLIEQTGDVEHVKKTLREALSVVRVTGATKASLLLDELNLHAASVADKNVAPLLAAVFEVADELHVDSDAAKGFAIANNNLRIHWLLRRLILDRFDIGTRSAVLTEACKLSALGWFVDLAESAYRDYYPREGKEPESEENCLTTEQDALKLHEESLKRIRDAATAGTLGVNKELPYLLYHWRDLANDDGNEVKQWTTVQLGDDGMVVRFAEAFTSYSWSQGMGFDGLGDTVARRTTRANVKSLGTIMDRDRFRARVEELVTSDQLKEKEVVQEFLEAWVRHDKNPNRD